MRKDAKKEDRTIVNHFLGVSDSFLFCRSPEKCVQGRQINVTGKFWNLNRGHMRDDEANTLFKCTVRGFHALHKWAGGGVQWSYRSSLSEGECQCFVSVEDGTPNEFEMM